MAMLDAPGRSDHEEETVDAGHTHHLEPGQPEVLDVLERLSRDHQIDALSREGKAVGVRRDQVDVRARLAIEAEIAPAQRREDRTIATIDVLTTDIEDDAGRTTFQVTPREVRHVIVGAAVHAAPIIAKRTDRRNEGVAPRIGGGTLEPLI